MKYALTAAAIVFAATAANAASNPPPIPVWKGDMAVTSASAQCAGAGITVGDVVQAAYAPGGLQGSAQTNFDMINLFFPRGTATHWQSLPGTTLNTSTALNGVVIFRNTTANTKVYQTAQAAKFTVSPAKITTGTPTVTIAFTRSNFAGVTGCDFQIQGVLTSQPMPQSTN